MDNWIIHLRKQSGRERDFCNLEKSDFMKKILILACCCILLALGSQAQRYAIVDTKYILEKMPDYKDAQKRLDGFSELWQKEIDDKQSALDKMYKDYEGEQAM